MIPYIVDIEKDCSITFDTENLSSKEEYIKIAEGKGKLSDILGFHEEKNFCWLGCNAGGDWEEPVFFIVLN